MLQNFPLVYSEGPEEARISFATYNVNQGPGYEKSKATSWSTRKHLVRKLISNMDPDILCLQELRTFSEVWVGDLASDLGYDFYLQKRNPQDMAMGQAILWKRDMFFACDRRVKWLTRGRQDIPNDLNLEHACPMATGVRLLRLAHGRKKLIRIDPQTGQEKALWVYNTHFPLAEDKKDVAVPSLVSFVKETSGQDPVILAGDFNFFEDGPEVRGSEQRQALIEGLGPEFKDLGSKGHVLASQPETFCQGTFFGYDTDEYKCPLVQGALAPHGRLDNIYVRFMDTLHPYPILFDGRPGLRDRLEHPRAYPSDHFPLTALLANPQ